MARDLSSVPRHLQEHIIISRNELLMLVPYSMAHVYRLEAADSFPRRIQLGRSRVGWRLSEVLAWLEERPRAPKPGMNETL